MSTSCNSWSPVDLEWSVSKMVPSIYTWASKPQKKDHHLRLPFSSLVLLYLPSKRWLNPWGYAAVWWVNVLLVSVVPVHGHRKWYCHSTREMIVASRPIPGWLLVDGKGEREELLKLDQVIWISMNIYESTDVGFGWFGLVLWNSSGARNHDICSLYTYNICIYIYIYMCTI